MIRDGDRDSDESELIRYRRIVGIIESCSATLSFISLLLPSTLASVSILVFPILPEWPASRKIELQKNHLSAFGALNASRNARLARLSESPVEGVCGQSLLAKIDSDPLGSWKKHKIKWNWNFTIWRLKFPVKMGQIEKDSQRFPAS